MALGFNVMADQFITFIRISPLFSRQSVTIIATVLWSAALEESPQKIKTISFNVGLSLLNSVF